MPNRLEHVQLLIDRLRALLPVEVEEKEYLAELLYDAMARSRSNTPMGVVGQPAGGNQVFSAALRVLEHLDQPTELAAMPEGIVGLTHLAWENRPALPLQQGRFQPLAVGPWQHLSADLVQQQTQSVCRLDLCVNGVLYQQLGSGFVVSVDQKRLAVMTNAHVVEAALQIGWPTLPTLTLTCDFHRESALSNGALLPVAHNFQLHASHDLALLTLDRSHFTDSACPAPLCIAASMDKDISNLPIGVIGHPALDTQRDGQFPIQFGFGNEFGIKRFAPGLVRTRALRPWYKRYPMVDALFHDATTLSGSSGSCILDLQSGHIIGLHFGGWPLATKQTVTVDQHDYLANLFYDNGAVPLWTLVQDALLQAAKFV